MKSPKKWGLWALILTICILLALGTFTAVIDPVFHYHKPLPGLSYYLWDERYQNDGIVKQFDYDAIITGTSMTENIRASEVDALFGVNSVKTPFSGTTLREIANHLRRAFRANDGIKMVVMGIDGKNLFNGVEELRTDEVMPDYLYDDNLLNDVSYVLNKDILLRYTMMVLQQTYYGNETTSFDKYANWWDGRELKGPEAVWTFYDRRGDIAPPFPMTPELEQQIRDTVRANVVSLAEENPDTLFYCYFSPYSLVHWDQMHREGALQLQLESYRIATEELLKCGNIRLFSFYTVHEWTHDLNNYSDMWHHSDIINSRILEEMHAGNHQLTLDNYEAYWDERLAYYSSFDYDTYMTSWGWTPSP